MALTSATIVSLQLLHLTPERTVDEVCFVVLRATLGEMTLAEVELGEQFAGARR